MYDPIAKKITKEIAHKILKEYRTDRMQLDKSVFIHNTAVDLVVVATTRIPMSQEIEENNWVMSLEFKQLRERVSQVEIENNQLKVQASSATTMIFRLDDFTRCALEQAEELYKARHNTYINIQNIQYDYSSFRQ